MIGDIGPTLGTPTHASDKLDALRVDSRPLRERLAPATAIARAVGGLGDVARRDKNNGAYYTPGEMLRELTAWTCSN